MTEPHTCRLFVAIPVPEHVKAVLKVVQDELSVVLPRRLAAWTKPAAMHLTLRFLGNVAGEQVDGLQQRMRQSVAGFGELHLVCERLGCFPDLRHPRVVWAWVHDQEDRLSLLARRVDQAVSAFAGKPPDTCFTGHVTLARPRRIQSSEAKALANFVDQTAGRTIGTWTASTAELLRSELAPHGSRYTSLATIDFGGGKGT